MTIKNKLIGAFVVLILIAGSIFALSTINMADLNNRIGRIADSTAQKIKFGAKINQQINRVSQAEKDLILTNDPEEMNRIIRQIEQSKVEIDENLLFIENNSSTEGKQLISTFGEKWSAYLGNLESVKKLTLANSNTKAAVISKTKVLSSLEAAQRYLSEITEDLKSAGFSQSAYDALTLSMLLSDTYAQQNSMIRAREMQEMNLYEDKIQSNLQKIELISSTLSNRLNGNNKTLLGNFTRQYDQFLTHSSEVRNLTSENSNNKAFALANTVGKPLQIAARAEMAKLVKLNDDQLTIDKQTSDEAYASANVIMISVLIISILLSIVIAWWIITGISKGLKNATHVVERVSKGDFSQDVENNTEDEIGEVLSKIQYMMVKLRGSVALAERIADGDLTMDLKNDKNRGGDLDEALEKMVDRLKEVAITIRTGTDNIASASHQVSSSSQQLAEGSQEQASSTQQASSAMEQMAANIQQNKDNAQQTNAMATKAAEDIRISRDHVNESVEAIDIIAEKISVISEIASKTDLLALNAAVEAARAGEHGKGFAVVAAEVRKLAERSQKAAIEIDEISLSTVEKAKKSGKMLNEVVPDIEKTAELIKEISASTIEQSTGSEQVNTSIQQLSEVIQENASASEELASSSEELNSQAEEMKSTVGFFKIKESSNQQTFDTSPYKKEVSKVKQKPSTPKSTSDKSENGFDLEMSHAGNGSSNGHDYDDRNFESFD